MRKGTASWLHAEEKQVGTGGDKSRYQRRVSIERGKRANGFLSGWAWPDRQPDNPFGQTPGGRGRGIDMNGIV